jgi:hypothetical protein
MDDQAPKMIFSRLYISQGWIRDQDEARYNLTFLDFPLLAQICAPRLHPGLPCYLGQIGFGRSLQAQRLSQSLQPP